MDIKSRNSLTNAAGIMMVSIVLSRITGYVREILVPHVFANRVVSDAYNTAFKITDIMYSLLIGGAISAALIPVLTSYITKGNEEEGWKVVGTFINVIFTSMIFICALGMVFTPQLMPFLAYAFKGERYFLTIRLARILFPSVAFLMLAGLTNGVLNSYQRFAAAAFGPVIYNIGSTLSIAILHRYGVEYVAFGVMASSFLYFILQISFAADNLKYYRPFVYLKHPGFKKIMVLAIPSIVSSSIVQVNAQITNTFSSGFDVGSITSLRMADRIWQLPLGIFAMGIGIAMLPTLSSKIASKEFSEFKDIFSKGLQSILFVTMPAAVGLIVLNKDIVRLLFKFNEKVTETDLNLAAGILLFFSFALISQSIVQTINRGFYAIHDTRTPLLVGGTTVGINIILCFYLINSGLGAAGMALAYTIVSALNAITLLVIFNAKVKGIYPLRLIAFILKAAAASILMGLTVGYLNSIITIDIHSKISQLLSMCIVIFIGMFVYFTAAYVLRIQELYMILEIIVDKLKLLRKMLPNIS